MRKSVYERVGQAQGNELRVTAVVLVALSVARWLFVTLLYAVLTPWLLAACLLCLASFLPHDLWSFREIVTEGAFANSEAWRNAAITWHSLAQIAFVVVCATRIVCSAAARAVGCWLHVRISKWVDAHLSEHQQSGIGKVIVASILGGCVALVIAGNKTERRLNAQPIIERPSIDSVSTAAAIRLSTGRVVSGEAKVSAGRSGEFLVRFKDQ